MVVEGLRFAPDRSGVRVPAVMEEFANILQRDYGLKPQGKAAPMTAVRGAGGLGALGVLGVGGTTSSGENGSSRRDAVAARRNGTVPGRGSVLETGADEYGEDGLFASVGVRRSNNNSNINSDDPFGLATGSTGYGDVFGGPPSTKYGSSKYSSMSGPEDIFRVGSKSQAGVSKSSNLHVYDKPVYDDDFFGGVPGIRAPATAPTTTTAFDDVFGGAGPAAAAASSSAVAVDDLLGGFPAAEERKPKTAGPSARAGSRGGPGSLHSARSLGRDTTIFDDLLSGESSRPGRKASSRTSNRAEKQFSSADPSQEQSSYVDPIISIMQQNSSSVRLGSDAVEGSSDNVGSSDRSGLDGSDDFSPPPYVTGKSSRPVRGGRRKDTPSDSSALRREGSGVPQQFGNDMEQPAVSVETARSESPTEDKWVTVEDVKLVTPPSTLPPPARPAPLVGEDRSGASPQHGVRSNRGEQSRLVTGKESDARTASQRQPASSSWGVGAAAEAVAAAAASGVDGLEEFISGVLSKSGGSSPPEEGVRSDVEGPGAQAAMKEAMERAEVKLRVAKEARARDREEKQREAMIARAIAREKEEREAREEKEREKLRKEREKEREMEREKDRAAERAAERAAAERAAAEARERAERAAVERAAAEARERAAAKAAAERAAAERAAAERAATERAAAEARERAERAAAERAKDQQRRSDNDFDRLFSTRPTSEPRRPVDPTSDQRSSQTFGVDAQQRRASASTAGMRRVSSTTNIDNDWTSLFSSPSQEEFQEIEGETADRRKARWERHQRTTERATKALQEKKQRELDLQREQAEKHRAGEVLDTEIKRWAAGKEGNLRALLSSLQYVLWPECGWQAVSLTDLITPQAVKKAYRKATLCVHPDKVQQKGATVQQKYIAEKVFDLLKESWNKFNSEELF